MGGIQNHYNLTTRFQFDDDMWYYKKNQKIDFFYKMCMMWAHNKIGQFIFLKTEAPINLKHFLYTWYENRPLFWKVIWLQSDITKNFVFGKSWETYKIHKFMISLWSHITFQKSDRFSYQAYKKCFKLLGVFVFKKINWTILLCAYIRHIL